MDRKGAAGLIIGIVVAVVVLGIVVLGAAAIGKKGNSPEVNSDSDSTGAIPQGASESNQERGSGLWWCVTGKDDPQIRALVEQDGIDSIEGGVVGTTTYDGRTACHAMYSGSVQGGQAQFSVDAYVYQPAVESGTGDAWIIVTTSAQGFSFDMDYHWEDGMCIEGKGCDTIFRATGSRVNPNL